LDAEIQTVLDYRNLKETPADAAVTAHAFLVFMRHLRTVVLQDAAAMLVLYPEREGHVFFRTEVFQSVCFSNFKDEIRSEVLKTYDRVRATVDDAIPGVMKEFDGVNKRMDELERSMERFGGVAVRTEKKINQVSLGIAEGMTVAAARMARTAVDEDEDDDSREDVWGDQAGQQGEGGLEAARGHDIQETFECVKDMVDCWFGRGRYFNMPIEGGLKACEDAYRSGWRKHYTPSQKVRFSRLKRVAEACDGDRHRIGMLENEYQKSKRSLAGVVEMAQNEGWIVAKTRNKKAPRSPVIAGN
jgi:tetrahydromethanopterin S-methyltransferase subunit G